VNPGARERRGSRAVGRPVAYDAGVEERSACAQLKRRFEAAGFQIKENQTFDEDGVWFEIDGFDAARRVGYEYVTKEAGDGWDVDGNVIAALSERRKRGELHVLVVDEADAPDAETLDHAIDEFLRSLPAQAEADDAHQAASHKADDAHEAAARKADAAAEDLVPAAEVVAVDDADLDDDEDLAADADLEDDSDADDAVKPSPPPRPPARPSAPPKPPARSATKPSRPPPTPKGAKKKPARKSK